MSETGNAQEKEAQRRAGIAARRAISRENAAKCGSEIAYRMVSHIYYQRARTIFSYQPVGGEVDVSSINQVAELSHKIVAYPVCTGEGIMVAAVPETGSAWEEGKYGIRAPLLDRSRILSPEEIDLVLVPCTAFDEALMRVGMGAGYYDRYLPQCTHAIRVAVAYEAQKVSRAAADPWDFPMDAILTEKRWYTK